MSGRGRPTHVGGVGAPEDRVEEPAVLQPVDPAGGVQRRRPVVVRRDRVEVERDADLRVRRGGADGVDGQPVAEQQVVGGGDRGGLGSVRPGACRPEP